MGLFSRKKLHALTADIHSHLLPGIDDGAADLEKTLEMVEAFEKLGFQKLITTPHIHPNYPNTPEGIRKQLEVVEEEVRRKGLNIQIEAAAEYYVDESFLDQMKSGADILSFGDKYVLVESAFLNKPIFFEDALFQLKSKGYQPVLAHPERYRFLEGKLDWLYELKAMGILFQVTVSSLIGYYGEMPKKMAQSIVKSGMVDFLGSDLHKFSQIEFLEKGLKLKPIQTLLGSNKLLNNTV